MSHHQSFFLVGIQSLVWDGFWPLLSLGRWPSYHKRSQPERLRHPNDSMDPPGPTLVISPYHIFQQKFVSIISWKFHQPLHKFENGGLFGTCWNGHVSTTKNEGKKIDDEMASCSGNLTSRNASEAKPWFIPWSLKCTVRQKRKFSIIQAKTKRCAHDAHN